MSRKDDIVVHAGFCIYILRQTTSSERPKKPKVLGKTGVVRSKWLDCMWESRITEIEM